MDVSLVPIYNGNNNTSCPIDQDENEDSVISLSHLTSTSKRMTDQVLDSELRMKDRQYFCTILFLSFSLVMTTTFMVLSLTNVIGHHECDTSGLPECTPPNGFIHSFQDLTKTMEAFTCPKALDMIQALYFERIATCFDTTIEAKNHRYPNGGTTKTY